MKNYFRDSILNCIMTDKIKTQEPCCAFSASRVWNEYCSRKKTNKTYLHQSLEQKRVKEAHTGGRKRGINMLLQDQQHWL